MQGRGCRVWGFRDAAPISDVNKLDRNDVGCFDFPSQHEFFELTGWNLFNSLLAGSANERHRV